MILPKHLLANCEGVLVLRLCRNVVRLTGKHDAQEIQRRGRFGMVLPQHLLADGQSLLDGRPGCSLIS